MALELYYEGSDFLYGALFRICFPYYLPYYNNSNKNGDSKNTYNGDTIPTLDKDSSNVVSFVFMSVPDLLDNTESIGNKNTAGTDDVNIETGIKCLRQLLPLSDDPSTCQIVVLASQPIIVERVTKWITSSKRQCTIIRSSTLAQSSTPTTLRAENNNTSKQRNDDKGKLRHDYGSGGSARRLQESKRIIKRNHKRHWQRRENAKIQKNQDESDARASSTGIYRISLSDLALTSNLVRTGVIGHVNHPDFQLLVEWISYQRQIEYLDTNGDVRRRRSGRRQLPSVATSSVEASETLEPLLWCEL